MKPRLLALLIALLLLIFTPMITTAVDNADLGPVAGNVLPGYAVIMLRDPPLASYSGGIPGLAPTMPAPGQKLDLNSPAAQAYSNYLANQRASVKAWLAKNGPQVQVIAEYSVVLNGLAVKLNGYAFNGLGGAPGVSWVQNDYLYSLEMNRSPTLINAPAAWAAVGGQANAGAGIKIGIIDTGINQTHPFLTDPSLTVPSGFPKCDARDSAVGIPDTSCLFVSNKVIVAKVFQTLTNFDAKAVQSHGSHVSGTAAGVANTCAPFVGCTLSGIAPKAFLGNYNVFPDNVGSASSHDIAKAVEAAVSDGMDVLNLSLGGGVPPPVDVLVNAVNSAVDAGVVVAIAAGNAGPASGTIESPGIAEKVITAGASTNPHFVGIPVTVTGIGTFGAALGQFHSFVPPFVSSAPFTATYNVTTPVNGCTTITNNLSGQIALIRRGACTFTTKIRNAQAAGAIGVIVYNNVLGDPVAMAHDGTSPFPTIPAVMVSKGKGLAMAAIAPNTVTIDATSPQEFFTDGPSADIIAGFSSRGPPILQTPGVGFSSGELDKVKPDVTAPGVNVYSSVNGGCGSTGCFAFFQGTSMATPHVAGSAAVLKQLHPDWSPAQVKSALVNTAHRPVKSQTSGAALLNPMDRGGGRIDLAAAISITATIETRPSSQPSDVSQPSVSFGEIPSSGIVRSFDITMASVSSGTVTYTIAVVAGKAGPSITPSVTMVTLASGGTAVFSVTLTTSPSLPDGDYFGDIVISGGTVAISVPYWVRIDPSGFPSSGHIFVR